MKKSMRRVVLITGATSGLGQVASRHLASKGYVVYGTGRYNPKQEVVEGVRLLSLDIASSESVRQCLDMVLQREGCIDVLINNAGIGLGGALECAEEEQIQMQLNVGFMGCVRMCQAILPIMRKQRSGLIVNVSSLGGVIGLPYQGYYSASKFAIEGFSEALALEAFRFGIRVTLIEPTDFRTDFTVHRQLCAQTLNHPDYADHYTRVQSLIDREEQQQGADPQLFARKIEKIIRRKRPRFRYTTGHLLQRFLVSFKPFVPDRLVQWGMRMYYRL